MRKISWLLGIVGGAALVSVAAVQGVAASTGPSPATMLKFDTMAPVTGPYVGPANPVRGVPGGGLPWMLTAGNGSLKRDGHLLVKVRGLRVPTWRTPMTAPSASSGAPIRDRMPLSSRSGLITLV